MANAVPQKALNWLHNVLVNDYRNVNRTYSDVALTLQTYPSFSMKTDVYTFENGSSSLLVNVQGTLPVSFRGNAYGFPISLWIPQGYPDFAPISFVTPTSEMAVRAGQHVSGEGRIYHPYLAGWRGDTSALIGFLSLLQEVFAREPPLVAKKQEMQRHRYKPQQKREPPPVPPLPPELGATRQNPAQPPPRPPKADDNAQSKYNMPAPLPPVQIQPLSRESQRNAQSPQHRDGHHHARQPYTQYIQQQANTSDQRVHREQPSASALQYTGAPRRDLRSPVSPMDGSAAKKHNDHFPPNTQFQQYQTRNVTADLIEQRRPAESHNSRGFPLHSQVAHQPQYQQYPPRTPQQLKTRPPEDLLTSPFDTAIPAPATSMAPPPIPPNPQKDALLSAISETLTKQIQSTHASTMSAIPPLHAQQAALRTTLDAVNWEMSQLNELEEMLSSNETILHQAMRDADKLLEDAKTRKVPNVDDVLVAPTVVAGQLYQAVAEERAIEDCRGVLAKALDKGRISSSVWAKQTRTLAREEFLKKTLIQKISKGMGLAEERTWR